MEYSIEAGELLETHLAHPLSTPDLGSMADYTASIPRSFRGQSTTPPESTPSQ